MEFVIAAVIAVLAIVAAAVFAKPLGIAAPLLLAVVGIGCSFLPGLPPIRIPPDLILEVVLPALLYSAAIRVPLVDFRRNLSTIFGLSVLLVLVSALAIGLLLHLIIPGVDLGAAIAVGAIVSPTDAVAATAIGKKLGLPSRLLTVLEGESLVNDASALVLLKTAIAAIGVTTTGAELWGDVGSFFRSVGIGIGIGLAVGIVTVFVRSRLKDPVLDTALSFVVPFIAYIPVTLLGASGVIGVVVVGLYTGHKGAQRFTARSRFGERLNWGMVQFLLENGVFLLMGLQLMTIVRAVPSGGFELRGALLVGLLVAVVLLFVRAAFVAPMLWRVSRKQSAAERGLERMDAVVDRFRERFSGTNNPRLSRRRELAERNLQRRTADLMAMKDDGIGWRGGLVLTWAGMRGVVTLAAAQSVPETFPMRPQMILVAFTVAIVTLLLQGGTLPWVIRASGIRGADDSADRHTLATLLDEISTAGLDVLENAEAYLPSGQEVDPTVLDRLRDDTRLRTASARERADAADSGGEQLGPHAQYRALHRVVIRAERNALMDARDRGGYPSRVLTRAENILDTEEIRLA